MVMVGILLVGFFEVGSCEGTFSLVWESLYLSACSSDVRENEGLLTSTIGKHSGRRRGCSFNCVMCEMIRTIRDSLVK
jgi:hypothetical protein